jgi:hypothetical protein
VYLSLIFPFSLSPLCVVLFAIILAIQLSYIPPSTVLHKIYRPRTVVTNFCNTRCSLIIECVHFRACFADLWVTESSDAAVLSIEGVHFRACFADSWASFQGMLRSFMGHGSTIHRGCSFQGLLR